MTVSGEVEPANAIDPRVMAEAEQWLSRMESGQRSAGDRQAFERWRAQPMHAAAYEAVEQFWRVFDAAPGDPQAQALVARTLTETAGRAPGLRRPRLSFALAATVSIGLFGIAALVVGRQYVPTHVYATEAGQRSTVQLDDGSQIALNSATRLSVKFTAAKRQLTLKEGEAIFTVAPDPNRPFTVRTGDGEVIALGTRFQVRKDAGRVVVTLLEGRIAVDRGGAERLLQMEVGEQVRFVEDSPDVIHRAVDPEAVSSWAHGRLKFKDTVLSEVLEEVNRYSKTQIRLADASLASLRVTATFDMGNSASVVRALESLLPVDATVRTREQIVLTRR